MLRSVKSQIVVATSIIIIMVLGATAYFVIDQKIKEINLDIFNKAFSFAELTHERVVTNYENNYLEQAYANFDKELADIFLLNKDVTDLEIYDYNGNNLYRDLDSNKRVSQLSDNDLERIQHVYPSVNVKKSNKVVYLEKTHKGIRYTNFNGKDVDSISNTEQIGAIIYPFRDPNNSLRAYSIYYNVSYDALTERVRSTVVNITVLAIFGIIIALFIGGIVAGRITAPIKKLTKGAKEIGSGELHTRIEVKTQNEIGILANTFNKMAEDLQKSTQVLVEKEKMTKELELAGEIQRELLPKELPKTKNLDIAASVDPADEVGGDCYDFIPLNENNLLFYLGDVTGHGVPAGLVSAITNALVPAFLEHYTDPKELVIQLNRILKMKTRANIFMTMVMNLWNSETNQLYFTQAGHDPIVYYRASDNLVAELPVGGMALGMVPDISHTVKTEVITLNQNDVAVFYTDGIPEAWKNDKETYGMERFKASIKAHSLLNTAQEIHDAILKDVRDFMGVFPQADDITLIVVKRI